MEVALELIIMDTIVRVLCQCLYIVTQDCFGVDTDQIDCETALPVLELS